MPNVLTTQYYTDDFQVLTYIVRGEFTNGTAMLYADRDIVIDSVTFGVSVVGGAGSRIGLTKTTTGTLDSPASALAATIAAGTTLLNTAQSITTAGTFRPALKTPASDTNLIKAGNWLGFSGTAGGEAGTTVAIQIRFRSRLN
jgi:hypothetical protein